MADLDRNYADLIRIQNKRIMETPSIRLQNMQKKLENIFELINAWQQYIDVIYMTEIDVKLLDAVQDDASYAVNRMGHQKRVEEQNVKEKLNLLFGKDKIIDEKESSQAAYETVKEGETTDTTTTAWEDFGTDNEGQKV
jgi:superfamily I DNA and/or RNA helicase